MHDHRIGPSPEGLPDPASSAYHAERLVLKELLVDPPPGGDAIEPLGERLDLSPKDTRAAVAQLVDLGLAEALDPETVRAHRRARYFDHLLPFGA